MASTSQHPISTGDIFHTPVVLKETSGASYHSGDLEAASAVVSDLGPTIPQISFQSFLSRLFPSTYDVPKAVQKLEQGGHILNGRWVAFPVDPERSAPLEDTTFAPLQGLFKNITKCHSNHKPVAIFAQNPYLSPWSHRSNQTRPDGYFILKDAGPTLPTTKAKGEGKKRKVETLVKWDDIAISAEFKKKSTPDARDDVGNLALSMSLC